MWNNTEMYSASFWPSGSIIVSLNQALAEIHLSMINHWGEVQRDMIRRYTTNVEQASFVAATEEQTSTSEDAAPEPEDSNAEVGDTDGDERGAEVAAVDEPVAVNAATAILNNPALAAEAATRGANDAVDYEVRDDVADDIAAEIQREVRQELNPPTTPP